MSDISLFNRTFQLLHKVLDLRLRNQEIIAANIANAETQGYAPARLEFEQELQASLQPQADEMPAAHPRHFPVGGQRLESVEGRLVVTPASGLGDGNGVDLDREMIAQSENQLRYESAVQMLNKKLALLKYVAQSER
jgi:flagellar basal-body rod protein FlgB